MYNFIYFIINCVISTHIIYVILYTSLVVSIYKIDNIYIKYLDKTKDCTI